MYAIVDIETTGGSHLRDRIIEIAIVRHDGQRIVDSYATLLNPDIPIPPFITGLTGITNDMVRTAPRFHEVAKQIVQLTEGCVFVAHNVSFDYRFVQHEFRNLGYRYQRKQLCTVRLSRAVVLGLRHYNLDAMIQHFQIAIDPKHRHRALGDATATAQLFTQLLQMQHGAEQMQHLLRHGLAESSLPPHITLAQVAELPESTGVYYLHNQRGEVIYVGKSTNIRRRISEHFANKEDQASKIQHSVHSFSHEVTGSELIALLHESAEIKRLQPEYNRAQRFRALPYGLYHYLDGEGIHCFAVAKSAKATFRSPPLSEYEKASEAELALQRLMKRFELCRKYCTLDAAPGPCFDFHLHLCRGVCACQEDINTYNQRAAAAVESLKSDFQENMLIIDRGRHEREYAVVLIERKRYQGYGYLDAEESADLQVLRAAVRPQRPDPEAVRIIRTFVKQGKALRVLKF